MQKPLKIIDAHIHFMIIKSIDMNSLIHLIWFLPKLLAITQHCHDNLLWLILLITKKKTYFTE